MLICFSGGGTMGHITPLIGIIEEIEKKNLNIKIIYYGAKNSMEEKITSKNSRITFRSLNVKGLSKNPIKAFKSLILYKKASKQCINDFKYKRPDVVVATGGYVSSGVLLAAKKLKIPYIIHEQNVISGKTNKYFSRWAKKVFLSFIEASRDYNSGKYLLTGNPTPIKTTKSGIEYKNLYKVLIIGGSLGAEAINKTAAKIKNKSLDITLVCGKREYDKYKDLTNIRVISYFEGLTSLINEADLVVSRAGATTIYEIISLGKPFIVIPSPNVANNHQYKNAKMLELKGCAKMIEDKKLNKETLEKAILEIKLDEQLRRNMIQKQLRLKIHNPQEVCLKRILELTINGK